MTGRPSTRERRGSPPSPSPSGVGAFVDGLRVGRGRRRLERAASAAPSRTCEVHPVDARVNVLCRRQDLGDGTCYVSSV